MEFLKPEPVFLRGAYIHKPTLAFQIPHYHFIQASYALTRSPFSSLLVLVTLLMVLMGGVEAGFPSVTPTVGGVWPRPLAWETQDTYYVIRPDTFKYGHS